jgi:hypothetical protein
MLNARALRTGESEMKIKPLVYGIVVLALFFGVIGGAKAAGLWAVSGKLTGTGEQVQPTGANVEEIKGWMTLSDVSTAYNVPVEEILAAFALAADTPGSAQLKELESPTFSVRSLRDWLATLP